MLGEGILLRGKQARMLMLLRDEGQEWYISSIAREAGTTYVSACNFLLKCERLGIVGSEKHGKVKSIRLTEKGARIAGMLDGIYSAISEKEESKDEAKEA